MKKEKAQKKINPSSRAKVWNVADKTVAFLPLAVVLGINFNTYFATETSTSLSNGIGLGLLGIFVALMISKKTNIVKGAGGFVLFFAICFFLRAILNDLVLLSGATAAGQVVSAVWTGPKKEKWDRISDKTETAEINFKYEKNANMENEVSGRV